MIEVVVSEVISRRHFGVIFNAKTRSGEKYRVISNDLSQIEAGETYKVSGEHDWYVDKYKRRHRQIKCTALTRVQTTGNLILPFLATLPGIGATRANRLWDTYGEQLISVLSDPQKLEELATTLQPSQPNLGRKLAIAAQAEYRKLEVREQSFAAEFAFYSRLESFGFSNRNAARKLWRLLGASKAEDALAANPYLSATIVPWMQADSLGLAILKAKGECSPETHRARLIGAIDSATKKLLSKGHTCAAEREWICYAPENVDGRLMLSTGLETGYLIKDGSQIFPRGTFYLEQSVADALEAIHRSVPQVQENRIEEALRATQEKLKFPLTSEQLVAVRHILQRPLACLKGGAGVGKTTVMEAVTATWEQLGGNVIMCALAGKAALQLSRATSSAGSPRLAITLARLIAGLKGVEIGKNPTDMNTPNERSLIIIDEASMVDIASMHELLSSLTAVLPKRCKLLLVGDEGQLPPVGFGSVFHQMAKIDTITSSLTKPLRQISGSSIPKIANSVRKGVLPQLEPYVDQTEGVQIVQRSDRDQLNQLKALHVHLSKRLDIEDIIVCAARNSTVEAFNHIMTSDGQTRTKLSPFASVCEGDPIICVRNHYRHGLFNGMLGVVRDTFDGVLVSWDGALKDIQTGKLTLNEIPDDAALDIRLSYAITCHKSQGSSADTVVVVIEDTPLCTREWLYTAITRARRQVVIHGNRNLLEKAISRRSKRSVGFHLELEGTQ